MKPIEHINALAGRTFTTKKAAGFSGTPMRTAQLWTERGFISPALDTSGTGHRRAYTVMNCIEIGIIKELSGTGIDHDLIAMVAKYLALEHKAEGYNKLEMALLHDHAYLAVGIDTNRPDPRHPEVIFMDAPGLTLLCHDAGEPLEGFLSHWGRATAPKYGGKVIIINLCDVARRVLAAIG